MKKNFISELFGKVVLSKKKLTRGQKAGSDHALFT